MKYLFLEYRDGQQWNALSSAERDTFAHACQANNELLRQRGHLLAVANLASSDAVVTVQMHNGTALLADEAVATMQEQLTELCLIQARDLNEAIRVAAQMPQARRGPIEVRLVEEPS